MKTRTERLACCALAVSNGCEQEPVSGMAAAAANRDEHEASSFGLRCRPSRAGTIGERVLGAGGNFSRRTGECPPWQLRSCNKLDQSPITDEHLAVRLKAGEQWSCQPPAEHTALWTAVGLGSVHIPDELQQGELVAFKPSGDPIEFEAESDAEFVLGSAVSHDYDLVLSSHSVHTSTEALREAEAQILTIQTRLSRQGRF